MTQMRRVVWSNAADVEAIVIFYRKLFDALTGGVIER